MRLMFATFNVLKLERSREVVNQQS
jgi:hypothetical protein